MTVRMRHTRGHTANRRSHHALTAGATLLCPECSKPRLKHAICTNCGKYKGRVAKDVFAKIAKKEKKQKEREREQAKP